MIGVCLILSLPSCVRTQQVKPDPGMTLDCDYPVLQGDTYRDLAVAYDQRGKALKNCTDRMRAIRGE